jgi:hypothetical protein
MAASSSFCAARSSSSSSSFGRRRMAVEFEVTLVAVELARERPETLEEAPEA